MPSWSWFGVHGCHPICAQGTLFDFRFLAHVFHVSRYTQAATHVYNFFQFPTARQSSVPLSKVIYQMFWRCGIMNHSYESRVIESLMTGAVPQIHADGGRNVRARLLVQAVHATLD